MESIEKVNVNLNAAGTPGNTHPVLLFDGVCNLCNGFVNYIIKNDGAGKFRFASLQSDTGQELLKKFNLPPDSMESFVLIQNKEAFIKSTAAIKVFRELGIAGKLFSASIIIPKRLRDFIYDFIARNRYLWFGKKSECMVPTPEVRNRFLP